MLVLWCFNATFNNISVISWWSVYWWRKPENPEETTDLSQVTDKLYHIMLYTSIWSRFQFTTSVVIGTDCIVSCNYNYHTIMTMMAPDILCVKSIFILYVLCVVYVFITVNKILIKSWPSKIIKNFELTRIIQSFKI